MKTQRTTPIASNGDSKDLSFTISVHGAVVRVRLTGELDVASAPRLVELVDDIVPSRATCIALDLSRVSFVDLHGLETVDMLMTRHHERDSPMVVIVRPGRALTRLRAAVSLSGSTATTGRFRCRPGRGTDPIPASAPAPSG